MTKEKDVSPKIRSVHRPDPDGNYMAVGTGGVTEIIDRSLEYEDSIIFIYEALNAGGEIIQSFINGAFDITYFTTNKNN